VIVIHVKHKMWVRLWWRQCEQLEIWNTERSMS